MLVKGTYLPCVFTRWDDNQCQLKEFTFNHPAVKNDVEIAARIKGIRRRTKKTSRSIHKPGGWSLVGEAYVEGLVRGEASTMNPLFR